MWDFFFGMQGRGSRYLIYVHSFNQSRIQHHFRCMLILCAITFRSGSPCDYFKTVNLLSIEYTYVLTYRYLSYLFWAQPHHDLVCVQESYYRGFLKLGFQGGFRANHTLFTPAFPGFFLSSLPSRGSFSRLSHFYYLYLVQIVHAFYEVRNRIIKYSHSLFTNYYRSLNIIDYFGKMKTIYRHSTIEYHFMKNGIIPWEFNLNTNTNFVISYRSTNQAATM